MNHQMNVVLDGGCFGPITLEVDYEWVDKLDIKAAWWGVECVLPVLSDSGFDNLHMEVQARHMRTDAGTESVQEQINEIFGGAI